MNAFLPAPRMPRFALVALVLLAALSAGLPALTRHPRRSGRILDDIPLAGRESGQELLIRLPLTVMHQLLVGARP